jgi:cell division protein FtsB
MLQGLNSFQRHHRQKVRRRVFGNLLIAGLLLAAGVYSYRFGEQQMAARMGQRMDEVQQLTRERDRYSQEVVDLKAESVVSQQKIAELEARYREQIPDAQTEAMIKIVREKLAAGIVSRERLLTILAAASNPRSCRSREVKRFMLSTSINQGTDSSATFSAGAVVVSGEGQMATSADGKPEAWFDAAKPVSMKFRLIGGRVTVAEGKLPLTHNIIDDTVEYRYTVEAGPRGFVSVSGDVCDYNIAPTPEAPAAGGSPEQ